MREKKFIIVSSLFFDNGIGGGETLFIRMCEWISKKNGKAYFITNDLENFNPKFSIILKQHKIKLLEVRKQNNKLVLNNNEIYDLTDKQNYKLIGIAFQKKQYELLSNLFKGENDNIYFYNIYWGDAVLHFGKKNKFSQFIIKNYILQLLSNNGFACMDSVSREIVENYAKIEKNKIPVVMLGNYHGCKKSCNNRYNDQFIIATVSRMDFPFKGYVIGLIKDVIKLSLKYNNIKLLIVGDGSGLKECKDMSASYECISFLGKKTYDELKEIYSIANIYVGMGTTLLEASQFCIPSIVANSYQIDNSSPGYFDETNVLGYPLEGAFSKLISNKDINKYTFYELIEKIYLLSADEYEEKCDWIFKWYNQNYSMDTMMKYFTNCDTNTVQCKNIIASCFRNMIFRKLLRQIKDVE